MEPNHNVCNGYIFELYIGILISFLNFDILPSETNITNQNNFSITCIEPIVCDLY